MHSRKQDMTRQEREKECTICGRPSLCVLSLSSFPCTAFCNRGGLPVPTFSLSSALSLSCALSTSSTSSPTSLCFAPCCSSAQSKHLQHRIHPPLMISSAVITTKITKKTSLQCASWQHNIHYLSVCPFESQSCHPSWPS